MPFHFTVPPAPQLIDAWTYAGTAAAVIVGAAMVVWGRLIGRPLLTIGAGAIGLLAGGPLAQSFGLPPVIGQLVLTFIGLAGGFLLDRLVWGLLAGTLVAAAVQTAMFLRAQAPSAAPASQPATSPSGDSLFAYVQSSWEWFRQSLATTWDANSAGVLIVVCAIGGFFVVLGLIRPRLIRIVMTSLVGAVAIVGGLIVGVSQAMGWFWPRTWQHAYLPAAAAAALMALGIVLQYRWALKDEQKEKAREAKPPQKPKDNDQPHYA